MVSLCNLYIILYAAGEPCVIVEEDLEFIVKAFLEESGLDQVLGGLLGFRSLGGFDISMLLA